VSIGADGVLSSAGGAIGVVGVFTFPSGTRLKPEGANRYVAPDGVAAAISAKATIHQGTIESANQDAVQGTLDLLMMQRQAEMMQKALTVFHTELNRTACEDLPRV
jgi:flagellar basal-body rod protein FlgF/flagellar basal-body rod protein FlgG